MKKTSSTGRVYGKRVSDFFLGWGVDAFGGEEDTARGGWDARGERTTRRERGGRGLGFRSARDGPPAPRSGLR